MTFQFVTVLSVVPSPSFSLLLLSRYVLSPSVSVSCYVCNSLTSLSFSLLPPLLSPCVITDSPSSCILRHSRLDFLSLFLSDRQIRELVSSLLPPPPPFLSLLSSHLSLSLSLFSGSYLWSLGLPLMPHVQHVKFSTQTHRFRMRYLIYVTAGAKPLPSILCLLFTN